MWAHHRKLREAVQKLKKDNKKASGMMGPGGQEEQPEQGGGSEKRLSKHGGSTSHYQITSVQQCPENPKNKSVDATWQGEEQ
jgi:hypothetical protein